MWKRVGGIAGLCALLTLNVIAAGGDQRAIMSLVGVSDSSANLKTIAVATSGVAGDTRAIGNLVGRTDSAGNLYITLDAASVISGATFLSGNGACTATLLSYSYTSDTDLGQYRIGADNEGFCAGGAAIFNYNAIRVLFGVPIYAADGTSSAPSIASATTPTLGYYFPDANTLGGAKNGSVIFLATTAGFLLPQAGANLGFGTSGGDLFIYRDGAGIFACRNGTNACIARFYNTTDGTNKEYLSVGYGNFAANTIGILAEKVGTGTVRSINFGTMGSAAINFVINSAAVWQVSTSGHLLAAASNVSDVCASATPCRTGYFGTSLVVPLLSMGTTPATSGQIRLANGWDMVARNAANGADLAMLVVDAQDTVKLGSTGALTKIAQSGATPGTLANGDCWIDTAAANWTTAATTISLKCRNNAATRTVGSVTF